MELPSKRTQRITFQLVLHTLTVRSRTFGFLECLLHANVLGVFCITLWKLKTRILPFKFLLSFERTMAGTRALTKICSSICGISFLRIHKALQQLLLLLLPQLIALPFYWISFPRQTAQLSFPTSPLRTVAKFPWP